jgi:restriction system protein
MPTTDNFAVYFALFKALWPFLLLGLFVQAVPLFTLYRKRQRLAQSGIADIDKMDGKTFEECLETLFTRLGYAVESTPYRGDWGGDLVIVKDKVRTVVQAKRYQKSVGVRAVQEVAAAKAKYRCTEAMVVTNSLYTRQARELARVNRVVLWDREQLVEMLLKKEKVPENIRKAA